MSKELAGFTGVARPQKPINSETREFTYRAKVSREFGAGYIGIESLGDYRSVLWSCNALAVYNVYREAKDVPKRKGIEATDIFYALEWICDYVDGKANGDEPSMPASIFEIDGTYDFAKQRGEWLGCLLILGLELITSDDITKDESHGIYDKFKELTGNEVPAWSRHHVSHTAFAGADESSVGTGDETWLERLNRLWVLLRLIDLESADSKFHKLVKKKSDKVEGKVEPGWQKFRPVWWSATPEDPSEPIGHPDALLREMAERVAPRRKFRDVPCEMTLQETENLEEHEMLYGNNSAVTGYQTVREAVNPGAFAAISHWRAWARDVHRFAEARVDFDTITLICKTDGKDIRRLIFGPDATPDAEIFDILNDEKVNSIVIQYTLRYDVGPADEEFVLPVGLAGVAPREASNPAAQNAVIVFPAVKPSTYRAPSVEPRDENGDEDEIISHYEPSMDDGYDSPISENSDPFALLVRSPALPATVEQPAAVAEHGPPDSNWFDLLAQMKEFGIPGMSDQDLVDAARSELELHSAPYVIPPEAQEDVAKNAHYLKNPRKVWSFEHRDALELPELGAELRKRGPKDFERILASSEAILDRHTWKTPRKSTGLYQYRTVDDELQLDEHQRNRQQFIDEEYDGFDVFSPDGLLKWIRHAISKCLKDTRGDKAEKFGDNLSAKPMKNVDTVNKDLAPPTDTVYDGSHTGTATTANDQVRYERILMGDDSRAGPKVDASLDLMGMTARGVHNPRQMQQATEHLRTYLSETLPKVSIPVLASQVTGAVHMLYRTCGKFPLSRAQRDTNGDPTPQLSRTLTELGYDGPVVGGGILEDSPGMGKTVTALLFFTWWALHAEHKNEDGEDQHRPTLLLAPDGHVVRQWAEMINSNFKDINLIVAEPIKGHRWDWDTKQHGIKRFKTVDIDAMKDPETHWPTNLAWVWDNTDPRATKTIIISPYSTMRARTVTYKTVQWTRKKKQSKVQKPDESDNEDVPVTRPEDYCWDKRNRRWKQYFCNKWQNRCAMAMLDEGHLVRNSSTQWHWMVRRLGAPVNWLLTATPMVNGAMDIPEEARVIWPAAFSRLANCPEYAQYKTEASKDAYRLRPWKIWDWVDENFPDKTSDIHLCKLDPELVSSLVKSKDLQATREYFGKFDALISLRRTPASKLPGFKDAKDGKLSLDSIMTPKKVTTRRLKHAMGEQSEYLLWYLHAALEHQNACKNRKTANDDASNGEEPAGVFSAFRRMAICTASTQLARFNYYLEQQGIPTDVAATRKWRESGLTATSVLSLVDHSMFEPRANGRPPSRADRLKCLVYGSPKLRQLLKEIQDWTLPMASGGTFKPMRMSKQLVLEEFPLIAWYWEAVLNFAHIPAQVLHSGLESHERDRTATTFKKPAAEGDLNHLSILILMYTINSSGVNLDHDCSRVIVNTAASSGPMEQQGWGRVSRVSQRKNVAITRFSVENSYDQYRDAMQGNKAVSDLATKTYNEETLRQILKVVNTYGRQEIIDIQATVIGKFLTETHARLNSTKPRDETAAEEILADLTVTAEDKAEQTGKYEELADPRQGEDYYDNSQTDRPAFHKKRKLVHVNEPSSDDDWSVTDDSERSVDSEDSEVDEHSTEPGLPTPGPAPSSYTQTHRRGQGGGIMYIHDLERQVLATHSLDPGILDLLGVQFWDKRWKKHWKELSAAQKTKFDQELIYYCYIATLNPETECTMENLKDDAFMLERGLRLLIKLRFGQDSISLRVTPWINFHGMGQDRCAYIASMIETESGFRPPAPAAAAFKKPYVKKITPPVSTVNRCGSRSPTPDALALSRQEPLGSGTHASVHREMRKRFGSLYPTKSMWKNM